MPTYESHTSDGVYVERNDSTYQLLHKKPPFASFEGVRGDIERERRQRLTSVVDKFNEKTEIMRFDL